jgi:hypothetical protein
MSDRIRTLVKRISETRPVQAARREGLLAELRTLRAELDPQTSQEQARSLEAAILLLEFMSRSEDVATAETLSIVASLVSTIDPASVRAGPVPPPVAAPAPLTPVQHAPPQPTFRQPPPHLPAAPRHADVTQHADLRMTQEYLLGSILMQAGIVTGESLARALQLHTSSGIALGQCLVHLGAATPEQIAAAVSYQDRLRDQERAARHAPEPELQRSDLRLSGKQASFVQSMHTQVLGEVLIRLGSITRDQLERGLQVQRAANLHIGEALVESGAASWDQVKKGLEVQRRLRRAG